MNGSLKLTLAVALALGSTNALALGLGMIQVKSGLNEPLVAEIPVNGGPDETASLSVALAAAADFERVGLSRSRILVPLEFVLAPGTKGNTVIKVTTKEPVRDPFLDFLIEVNWAKGKLLREYTVLLDPPSMAPAVKGSRASTAPLKDSSTAAASAKLPTTKATKPTTPAKTTETPTSVAPSTSATAAAPSAAAGEYGPVAAGETLWEVAASTRPDDSVSVNQVMLALLRSNPNAFFRDNINSLKRGAILRVPSADEIRAAGSAAAAAAEVRSQNDAARGGAATSTPTLIADTGTAPRASTSSTTTTVKPKPTDRLELVPPKTGKDSTASSDKPGSGGTGDGVARAELARTKEALASREQEAGELKSRVRELEDLKAKNDKLLSLKDSELAALQQKLKELQDKSSKPSTTVATPVPTPSTTATAPTTTTKPPATSTTPSITSPKTDGITKDDIWGSASGDKPSTTTPPTTSATPPGTSTATPPATTATTPPSSSTTAPTGTSPATLPATPATTTTTTAPVATPGTDTGTATSPTTTTTTPTTPTPPPATPPKPATSTSVPAKPAVPAKVQPLEVAKPWYSNPNTWMFGLGGLALLGGLGFALTKVLGRSKAATAVAGGTGYADADLGQNDEEDGLLDRLAQYPDDTAAHLELSSLYYSQGDADKFEAAAQAMYAHIYDTAMPEWQQVQAMGRELVPSNPLFAEPAPATVAFGTSVSQPEPMRFDGFDDASDFGRQPASAAPVAAEDDAFDFDLADHSAAATPPPPPPVAPRARDEFALDLPSFDTQLSQPQLTPSRLDDDLIAADDAIGTKLDLAKAYLDMGDPDGAKSMLEEVVQEGSESQKTEARKLLAEIR